MAKERSCLREQEQDAIQAANDAAIEDELRRDRELRNALLGNWRDRTTEEQKRYHSDAISEATSNFDRIQLCRHTNLNDPPMATLLVMARSLEITSVS